jgi:hypothetical protein
VTSAAAPSSWPWPWARSTRPAAALLRADLLSAQGRDDRARAALGRAGGEAPDRPDLWLVAVRVAAASGDAAGALRLIDDAERRIGDNVDLRLLRLALWPGGVGADAAAFLLGMEKGAERFPPADRARLFARLAQEHARRGRPDDYRRLWRQIDALEAAHLPTATLRLDLALQGGDDSAVTHALAAVVKQDGADGSWAAYGEAARLARRAEAGDRAAGAEAQRRLAGLEKRRPTWSRVALLRAHLDDLAGDGDRALAGYLRAFDMGERQEGLVARLTRLLVERGRWADADGVLRRSQQELELRGAEARQAAWVALQARSPERAVALARLAVPEGSRGFQDQLWLG